MKKRNLIKSAMTFFVPFSFVLLFIGNAYAQWGRRGQWESCPGMMGGWGMGWFGGGFMILLWIIIIIALVFFIRWLVQSSKGSKGSAQSGSSAMEILKERYARGEINKEEFEEKKKDLI
jgi:putative membrane protein